MTLPVAHELNEDYVKPFVEESGKTLGKAYKNFKSEATYHKFCPRCGSKQNVNVKFCSTCGSKFDDNVDKEDE